MLDPGKRKLLQFLILPLVLGFAAMQAVLDPQVRKLHEGERIANVGSGLSTEFVLGPLLGLQQAVAGLLWVRCDEFFHSGDYDAVLPIVRMVTWLDPHSLDVFITGAWHLSYNFTDSSERSDRRYIPASQRLLEEGVEKNPNVYDIAFELGWQNTDKIKDYPRADTWYRKATTMKAQDEDLRLTKEPPDFVSHQLAHGLARLAKIEESVAVWRERLAKSEAAVKEKPNDFTTKNTHDAQKHNLELTLKRRFSRFEHEIDFDLDRRGSAIDQQTGRPLTKDSYVFLSQAEIDRKRQKYKLAGQVPPPMAVGQPRPPATEPAWNTAFDIKPVFTSAKVLDLTGRGRFNVGDGARVTIRLHDEDHAESGQKEFNFDVDPGKTIMIDQHSVKTGTWGRKIDMSKDPKIYSFSGERYFLVFEFNPRGTSPFVQDKFGWSGEGMTDKYLWTDTTKNPPVRMLRKVYLITRDQVMGDRPITEKDVVSNESYAQTVGPAIASGYLR